MKVFSKVKRPFSPGQRLVRGILSTLCPPTCASFAPVRSTSPTSVDTNPPSQPKLTRAATATATELLTRRGGFALANEDRSADAIVISTLPAPPPFPDHATLLAMDRTALLETAAALNARLPAALRIDVAPFRTESSIRSAIELLVGLRTRQDKSPAHARSKSLDPSALKRKSERASSSVIPSALEPPKTPEHLIARPPLRRAVSNCTETSFGASFGLYAPAVNGAQLPALEILAEVSDEEREQDSLHARPAKKRRFCTAASPASSGYRSRREPSEEEGQQTPTPTPSLRAPRKHHRAASEHTHSCFAAKAQPLYPPSPPSPHSSPLPLPASSKGQNRSLRRTRAIQLSGALANPVRLRVRPKERLGRTSTPPKRRALAAAVTDTATSSTAPASVHASGNDDAVQSFLGPPIRLKRKASALQEDSASELTFGLDGMSISIAMSRSGADLMDLSA
jgi:hypothetical protein